MFKKLLSALLIGTILFTATACTEKKDLEKENTNLQTTSEDENLFTADLLGFNFVVPEKWKNSQNIDSFFWEPSQDENEPFFGGIDFSFFSDEILEKLNEFMNNEKDPDDDSYRQIIDERKALLSIYVFRKNLLDKDSIAELTKLPNNEILGEQKGLIYYLSYPDKNDIQGLSKESRRDYDELYNEIVNVKSTIKLLPPTSAEDPSKKISSIYSFPKFQSVDIYGEKIDDSVFSKSRLTLINVWGTFCSPCIREMPDLEKLYQEMKSENVNIVGLIGDAKGNEKTAKDIISKTKVTFTNIIPDKDIEKGFLKDIYAFPTSVFVDSKGNIVGEPIIGAKSKEAYKKQIMKVLEEIEK